MYLYRSFFYFLCFVFKNKFKYVCIILFYPFGKLSLWELTPCAKPEISVSVPFSSIGFFLLSLLLLFGYLATIKGVFQPFLNVILWKSYWSIIILAVVNTSLNSTTLVWSNRVYTRKDWWPKDFIIKLILWLKKLWNICNTHLIEVPWFND